jgi:hypothetical protein
MPNRVFKADLTGGGESLEHLIARLKAQALRKPKVRPKPGPPDFDDFITSRRPLGGAGAAEAPLPKSEAGLKDLCAQG